MRIDPPCDHDWCLPDLSCGIHRTGCKCCTSSSLLAGGGGSGSIHGEGRKRARAPQPCAHLPRVPCCATASAALFCPPHSPLPLLPLMLANTSSSCATA